MSGIGAKILCDNQAANLGKPTDSGHDAEHADRGGVDGPPDFVGLRGLLQQQHDGMRCNATLRPRSQSQSRRIMKMHEAVTPAAHDCKP